MLGVEVYWEDGIMNIMTSEHVTTALGHHIEAHKHEKWSSEFPFESPIVQMETDGYLYNKTLAYG